VLRAGAWAATLVVVVVHAGCALPPFQPRDGGNDLGAIDGPGLDAAADGSADASGSDGTVTDVGDAPAPPGDGGDGATGGDAVVDALPLPDAPPSCGAPPAGTLLVRMGGNDATANGSSDCPFGTITTALAVYAASADESILIDVGPGSFGSGETFPLSLPTGVTLRGASPGQTTLNGNGPCPAGIEPCTVSVTEGAVQIAELSITNALGRGLVIAMTAVVDLSNVTIAGCSRAGLTILGDTTVSSSGLNSTGNAYGVLVNDRAVWDSTCDTYSGNNQDGMQVGTNITDTVKVTLTGARATDNRDHGILVKCAASFASSPPCLTLRGSTLLRNQSVGIEIASGDADLGTVDNPGGNVLQASSSANQNRDTGLCNRTQNPIPAEGNLWSTCEPLSAVVTSGCSGAIDIVEDGSLTVQPTTCQQAPP
jgi:hypothetical protein